MPALPHHDRRSVQERLAIALRRGRGVLPTFAVLAAVATIGALLTRWTVRQADATMREELLAKTRLVAETLDVPTIRSLTGTPSDLDSPEYTVLKRQFAQLKASDPHVRFIYLLRRSPAGPAGVDGCRKPGQVLFLVDNEPPESDDYSPPGATFRRGHRLNGRCL